MNIKNANFLLLNISHLVCNAELLAVNNSLEELILNVSYKKNSGLVTSHILSLLSCSKSGHPEPKSFPR